MRKFVQIALLMLLSMPVFAQNGSVQGFCQDGGAKVVTQGMNSTTTVQASYPRCMVTVYLTGTMTKPSIFSGIGGGTLGNPFEANTDGSWIFYAAQGAGLDVLLSGGTPISFPTIFALVDVFPSGGGGGGGGSTVLQVNGTPTSPVSPVDFISDSNILFSLSGANVTANISGTLPSLSAKVLAGGITNGVYEPYQCGTSNAPTWCSGSNACQYIASAITAMGSSGGIVDATEFSGNQTCSVNPLGTAAGNGVLLLGNATFQTTAEWEIPSAYSWRIIGSMRKAETSPQNTIIQAVGGFPTSTPVMRLGNGTTAYGQEVSNLTVDCNSVAGTTGVYSSDIQEQSGVEHVTILNCPNRGIWMNGSGSDGSGPFFAENYSINDVYVLPLTAGTSGTVACEFDGDFTTFHRLSAMTCGGSSTAIADSFIFDKIYAGMADNLNAESALVGYLIGNSNPVTSLTINGMQSSNITTTVVSIKSTDSSVLLSGIVNGGGSASQTLLDPGRLSAALTDFSIGVYAFGTGDSFGFTPIFSTSPNVVTKLVGLSLSNGTDNANYIAIDSGRTTTEGAGIQLSDRGTIKWSVVTDTSNNFEVFDNADSFQEMFAQRGGVLNLRSQGSSAINLNDTAGSGTGGVNFCSGGGSPTCLANISAAGIGGFPGILLHGFGTTTCINTVSDAISVGTCVVPLTGTTGTITGTSLSASCDSGTATVAGAVVGTPVMVSSTSGADVGGAFNVRASVTSANTVTVYVCGTGTPASLAYNVALF
jgi:hypothetical protein